MEDRHPVRGVAHRVGMVGQAVTAVRRSRVAVVAGVIDRQHRVALCVTALGERGLAIADGGAGARTLGAQRLGLELGIFHLLIAGLVVDGLFDKALHADRLVGLEARAGRDQMAQQHVLLETHQRVHRTSQGRLGEHLGGLLEAGARQEAFALQAGLGDAKEQGATHGLLRLAGLGLVLASAFHRGVGFLDLVATLQRALRERGLTGLLDEQHVLELVVHAAQDGLVHNLVEQQAGVAAGHDAHLRQHLLEDDLDVLVGDGHALRAVHVLHLVEHVHVQGVLALDAHVDAAVLRQTFLGDVHPAHHLDARNERSLVALDLRRQRRVSRGSLGPRPRRQFRPSRLILRRMAASLLMAESLQMMLVKIRIIPLSKA